ncbi:XdhC/CoxI family protein [Actinoplanes sp. NPDC051475]|uniref:XdhC family protein n=1 Tax=Actinoplanes sp. NPDC051475 TaxID=3157225 RepID=UPI00344E2808
MLHLAEQLHDWFEQRREFAVATVAAVTGSAPRQPGAAFAIDRDGTVIGSVSGGCVESALFELCHQAIDDADYRVETFGYSDDDAFAAGLTCGGEFTVVIQPYLPYARSDDYRAADRAAAAAARGESARLLHEITGSGQPRIVRLHARTSTASRLALPRRLSAVTTTGLYDVAGTKMFLDVRLPRPQMVIFGSTDFAAALAHAASFIGYHVTVCDARPVFTTVQRFPHADEVVVQWPEQYLARNPVGNDSAICILTHDQRFDIPLVKAALASPAAYVGAMGSRRTHEQRVAQLCAAGVNKEQLAKLRSPIGLDIGAATPEQTAISIVAEILSLSTRRSADSLSVTSGPIHAQRKV